MVINRDHESVAQLKVTWDDGTAMQEVNSHGEAAPVVGDALERPLEAGEACILLWEVGPAGSPAAPDPARP